MTTYKTADLVLASYLASIGFQCIDLIENELKKNMFFVFRFNEQLPTAVNLYITNGASVNPRVYHEAEKEMKNLLYSAKQDRDQPRI